MSDSFSTRLKLLLEQRQLSLSEVARALGMSTSTVHRWTRGGEIDYANLRALADHLGVNWIWLRYGEEAIESLQASVAPSGAPVDERRKYLGQIMENEARLHLAQDMAQIVTWEWNVLTNDLTAGPNAEALFGRPLEQVRPQLLPFEALDLAELSARFSTGPHPLEWDLNLEPLAEGAEERCFASRGRLVFDAQARPAKVLGVSIDITERKRMQRALEASEQLLRRVIETIPVGLWIADASGRITTANPEVERIWGGARYVGLERYGEYKGWWESTGEPLGSSGWTLARAVQHGETTEREIVNIEAFDGEKRTIIMSAIPLLDPDRKIVGAIEVNQDITSLKRAERSLRTSVDQWKAIFEQPLVGMAFEGVEDGVLRVNAKFAALLDSTPEDLASCRLEQCLDDDTWAAYLHRLDDARAGAPALFILTGRLRGRKGSTTGAHFFVADYSRMEAVFRRLVFVIESESVA